MNVRHEYHPAFCHLPDCRAYADPVDGWEFEPVHRSEPVIVPTDAGTVLGLFLVEDRDYPGNPHIELMTAPTPLNGPIWYADDPAVKQLGLSLNTASIVASVLRRLIRTATQPGPSERTSR